MRQRTTFFHHDKDAIEPSDLRISAHSINGPDLNAVREDRFTLSIQELPTELQELLEFAHELHVRWTSPIAHSAIDPLASRLNPGLHVFYTPRRVGSDPRAHAVTLCSQIQKLGASDCSSLEESFTKLPSGRFVHSASYQFFQSVSELKTLVEYAIQQACSPSDAECISRISSVSSAAVLDLSYDVISAVLKVTIVSDHKIQPFSITSTPNHRVEVGLLSVDPNSTVLDSHELGITGLLTVLGQDKKPSSTLFTIPARHKRAPARFSATILPPAGLHPTLQLQISSSKPPIEDSYCTLHTYLALPKTVFVDQYQFEDDLFLTSKNLTALRYISQPVDLEAPDYVLKTWGSSSLLEVKSREEVDEAFTAEIPLHLRYQLPEEGGVRRQAIPYPVVFWACPTEEGTKFPNNPFDRVNLGYDGLFGPRTQFFHLDPKPEGSSHNLLIAETVPVLDLGGSQQITPITTVVVTAGFVWAAWKLLRLFLRTGVHDLAEKETSAKKTQ